MDDSFSQFAWILTAELNLEHLNVIITRSFKLSGDLELNPGSYEIIRSVQGNLNQGNVALVRETAGRQCACNALFSICWSVVQLSVIYGTGYVCWFRLYFSWGW